MPDVFEGKLGRLPLPRDDRDKPMAPLLVEAPLVDRHYYYRPLMLNQGNYGTCEGNMGTGWLADGPITHPDIEALKDPATGEAYAQQLYVDATGDTSMQEGAYTRQILRVLRDRGLIGAYHAAASVDEIVQALLTLGPVMFASNWYGSLDRVVPLYGNAYIYVDEASGIRGGHAYLLDGIDLTPTDGPPFVRMHNSWGPEWAHGGTARITLDDLRKLFVGDAWIGTEVA